MLCSEKELGLGDEHGGILVLPAEAPLGADLIAYLGLDDWILEIEITPNRPDCLSVVGVAREIAALTGAVPLPARRRDRRRVDACVPGRGGASPGARISARASARA